jgi:hypothetical protein
MEHEIAHDARHRIGILIHAARSLLDHIDRLTGANEGGRP